ncbi:MAG: nucleoside kinase [Clostridia bacterium]|nr:nucleoside kinase [Clostridia bacterium]
MSNKVTVTIDDKKSLEVESGTSLLEIYKKVFPQDLRIVVAAQVNNETQDLNYPVTGEANLKYLDLSHEQGMRIYSNSLAFIFIRAVREILKDSTVLVEHSLAKGLYCEIKGTTLTIEIIKEIENRMREIVANDEIIEKHKMPKEKAIEIFQRDGQVDKINLLNYLEQSEVTLYKCGWLYDYFYSRLVPSTGILKEFALQFHLPGVIIRHPTPLSPTKVPRYIPQPKLASIFYETEQWAKIMEVDTVPKLNEVITNQKFSQLVWVAEALHEKKIADIADKITDHKDRGNIILIAGPSSSGKTTFTQRLMVQLMVNGLKPVSISVDDYFLNREDTPKDENGNYDFEALEALDVDLLNDHLTQLIQGREVSLPTFNFKEGKREFLGKKLQIVKDQPIILEGIHGLNEDLTYSIPKDHKFKIYISALTQLNLDYHNRIPTTDVRKLRRIVRDNQFRGISAITTIKIWPSVRRGEEKNIFPYQEEADIMFNSALIYELAILKPFAEKVLQAIGPETEEYYEAQRLLSLLQYSLPVVGNNDIPSNSIIREFIGQSCFYN